MRLARPVAALLAAICLAAPSLGQTWTQTSDYTPSGGQIASNSTAGSQLNTGGWIDVHGGKWQVDSSNRYTATAAGSAYGYNAYEAKAPVAASQNNKIVVKFTTASPIATYSTVQVPLRYSNASSYATAYNIQVNLNSGAAVSIQTVVGGSLNSTVASSTATSSVFAANTTYCLIASVYSPTNLNTNISAQLFQSDCTTALTNASVSASAEGTSAFQVGVTGVPAIATYVLGTTFNQLTTYTAPAVLQLGFLTATPTQSSITLSLSANLSGGSGSGYSYNIYRSTDPAFTPGAGNLLATTSTMPYVDSTAAAGTLYNYAVIGTDSASSTVTAPPAAFGTITGSPVDQNTANFSVASALTAQGINLVGIGDSRVYGQNTSNPGSATASTPVYWAFTFLKSALGLRNGAAYNGGVQGTTSANWQKGQTAYTNAAGVGSGTGMQALATTNPGYLQVFSVMDLGANDANGNVTAATHKTNMLNMLTSLLTDWPNAIVFVHLESYYTPNTYGYNQPGQVVLGLSYSYRAQTQAVVAQLAASYPGRIYLADTNSWSYFARNYATELASQASYLGNANGTAYLHQNDTGARSLGYLWDIAMAPTLYGIVQNSSRSPIFRRGFH